MMEAKWIKIPKVLTQMRPTAIQLYFWYMNNPEGGSLRAVAKDSGLSLQQLRTAMRDLASNELTNTVLTRSQHKEISDAQQVAMGQQHNINTEPTQIKNLSSSFPCTPITNSVELTPIKKKDSLSIDKREKEKRFPSMVEGTEDIWMLWLTYRAKKRKPYSSLITEEAAYKKAMRQSGWTKEGFKRVIMQSIENDWQGTFTLREDGTDNQGSHAATNEEVARLIAAKLAGKQE